ncbi:MAG: hypothetical protein PHR04_06620 [Syntrophomonadaceae bacterium]|nr:hypothetical protein [Syntrophomonadaceae bacterium]
MQLQAGERAIFAYFSDDSDARVAADVLIQAGYNEIRVDRISPYSASRVNRRTKTILSSLTMNNSGSNLAYGPLLAADPAASGMSSPYYEPPGSSSILLTLVCNDSLSSQAIELLRQYGASV